MSNLIRFPKKPAPERPILSYPLSKPRPKTVEDEARRVTATKDVARGTWFVIVWPFAPIGAMIGGWPGLACGLAFGVVFYGLLLGTMRYGREL